MAFFKFRSRGQPAHENRSAPAAAGPAESVEAMRRRARHRLLGAAVLVLVGVIGFPLLFDTQPRPVAVDIPIEIPDRNKVAPLPAPVAQTPAPAAAKPAPSEERTRIASQASSSGVITETADGREVASDKPVASAPPAETHPAPKPEPKPKPEAKPEPKPEAKPTTAAKPADDGTRARALLEGKAAAATAAAAKPATASDDAGRFVVQVGAFAEVDKAREVRQKLEKAGLKTYTNVAKTPDGERTRVRVGPFASRAEADKAAGKVKGLSLPAAVLSL
jgi:DedD protein